MSWQHRRVRVPDLDPTARTIVLVEGASDCAAVTAAAGTLERDLAGDGVAVVPMGGASNVGHFVRAIATDGPERRLLGLCDHGEVRFFERAFASWPDRCGARPELFVCRRDLEDELLRALGLEAALRVLDEHGELETFRIMQKQPAQRDRTLDQQLHRFLGIRSGRKERLAGALTALLATDQLPAPIRELLTSL